MKVIFLDVDGVLNRRGCDVLIEGFYFVLDEKIKLLKELVDATGSKIVLSSTWRDGWEDLEYGIHTRNSRMFVALRNKIKEFGLDFIGYTPWIAYTSRGKEIDLWLSSWEGEAIESFVILDDLNGKYLRPHSNRLVRTSEEKGLMPRHIEIAKDILSKPWK